MVSTVGRIVVPTPSPVGVERSRWSQREWAWRYNVAKSGRRRKHVNEPKPGDVGKGDFTRIAETMREAVMR